MVLFVEGVTGDAVGIAFPFSRNSVLLGWPVGGARCLALEGYSMARNSAGQPGVGVVAVPDRKYQGEPVVMVGYFLVCSGLEQSGAVGALSINLPVSCQGGVAVCQ